MRKTKKVIAGIITAAMLMSPAAVWAGPSITDKVTVVEDSVGKYFVTDKIEESEVFKTIVEENKELSDLIKDINESKKGMKEFKEELNSMIEALEAENSNLTEEEVKEMKETLEKVLKEIEEKNLDFLTGFMSLEKEENAEVEKNEDGNYDVKIQVPIITEQIKDVNILYYEKEKKIWDLIEPEEVDVEKQTIEFEIEDFSLISVLANLDGDEKPADEKEEREVDEKDETEADE